MTFTGCFVLTTYCTKEEILKKTSLNKTVLGAALKKWWVKHNKFAICIYKGQLRVSAIAYPTLSWSCINFAAEIINFDGGYVLHSKCSTRSAGYIKITTETFVFCTSSHYSLLVASEKWTRNSGCAKQMFFSREQ